MRAAFAAGAGQAFTCWSMPSFGSIEPQLTRIRTVQSRLYPTVMVSRSVTYDVKTPEAYDSTKPALADAALATAPLASLPTTLAEFGLRVLSSPDPAEKVRLTNAAAAFWASADTRVVGTALGESAVPTAPARPERPSIVESGEMLRTKDSARLGCSRPVYMLHALAHVELNAIDLAWDTALRFGEGMREDWFDDFLSIAVDEARHFGWLSARLAALNSSYGALPAHRIVWDAADCSKTSRRERLAVGQLCQEARGLDAGPKLAERLIGMGDAESARIVKQIAEEEVAHVSIGGAYFAPFCFTLGVLIRLQCV